MHEPDAATIDEDAPRAVARPTVVVNGLSHWFGTGESRKQSLTDNDLDLLPGELVILTGPSGSGKTTLLTLIGALRTVQAGTIKVLDQELRGLNNRELTEVRRGIGFIFQQHNLLQSLSALQNVRMALELKRRSSRETDRLAIEMLTRLGLADRLHARPRELSGGQNQRVAVARALVNGPKLILADEPTAALDKDSGRLVVDLLKERAATQGCTVLLVTHDNRVLDVADRIINMVDGRIVSEIRVEETVKTIEFLTRCSVFANQTPAALTEISQKLVKEHHPRGSSIIQEGDEAGKFYLIRAGEAEVWRAPQSAGMEREIVAVLGPGDVFGEAALITGQPRNASVTARVDTVVYGLNKSDFLNALSASRSFNEQLRKVFFNRQA